MNKRSYPELSLTQATQSYSPKIAKIDFTENSAPDAEAFYALQKDLLRVADELIDIKAQLGDAHMMLRSNRVYILHMEKLQRENKPITKK